ncbi:FitA-like ribbon-helix-helix domain-containing protein [Bordetella genomosp. 1]|nr:hypothetical protein [Bordetella genomosp. 1]
MTDFPHPLTFSARSRQNAGSARRRVTRILAVAAARKQTRGPRRTSSPKEPAMPCITLSDVPTEIMDKLRLRARRNGCSAEEELMAILIAIIRADDRLPAESPLVRLCRSFKLTDEEHAVFDRIRHPAPSQPIEPK